MDDELMGISDCAAFRGVTRAAIQKAVQQGFIPARKIGNSYVIKRSDCEAYAPASPKERGQLGGRKRWIGHEKPVEPVSKRPRGRPRKTATTQEGSSHDG